MAKLNHWNPQSWKNFPVLQQPEWPDKSEFEAVISKIKSLPALVFAGETRELKKLLSRVNENKAFVLQCGDCAESFDSCRGPRIHALLNLFLQMVSIIGFSGGKRVISIGRVAGQYAKPRSRPTEIVNDQEMPVYRGDMINSSFPSMEARIPDPNRILEGYYLSGLTLNLLRAFVQGGYSDTGMSINWSKDEHNEDTFSYQEMMKTLNRSLLAIESLGYDINTQSPPQLQLFTSHEALVLDYEAALTRMDSITKAWYAASAHMLWIGDRTRTLGEGHLEFLSGVENPIGVKVGPTATSEELLKICEKLNPEKEEGKLIFISRLGSDLISQRLPGLLNIVAGKRPDVIWMCDPMHGNTFVNAAGIKTRSMEQIVGELKAFFSICVSQNVVPGGAHIEMTPDNVNECLGGLAGIKDRDLQTAYHSLCDPRLNHIQAREVAREIAKLLCNSD